MTTRVLFLDHAGVLGGGELSLLDIARHFAATSRVALFADGPFRVRLEAAGVGVDVLDTSASVTGVSRGAGVRRALAAGPGVWRTASAIARRAGGFDLLYANSQKAFVVAALAAKRCGKPLVWHLRDILDAAHFSRFNRRLVVALANACAARVICNSEATRASFVRSGGRADLARVVHNGIDPAPYQAVTPADAARLRHDLGLGDGPVVGVFGRLAPWKGQHVLLDALAELPGVQAVVVGDALFGETDYAATLREKTTALGLTGRVHFLGFRSDIPALMAAVDIVAHTSVAPEPFGRVIVEGMLARRPVVATRAGGVEEIVENRVSGLLVDPGDAKALAVAIRSLLLDPDARAALAVRGYERAAETFTPQHMVRRVGEQIDEVVLRSRAAGA